MSRINFTNMDLPHERIDIRRARLPSMTPTYNNYDPLEHRAPTYPIEPWMAYLNVARCLLGPAMLFMPLAISQTGYLLGPIVVLFFGAVFIHTHVMLLDNLTEICRQMRIPHVSYRFGFRLAVLHGPPLFRCLGHNGPAIISILIFLNQAGVCIIFILLSANGVRDILDLSSTRPAILMLFLPFLILIYFMKNLQALVWFSIIGSTLNMLGFIMIMPYSISQARGEPVFAFPHNLRSVVRAIGVFAFNLTALGVILSLDKGLTKPQLMTKRLGIITLGMSISMAFCTAFGIVMYLCYGTLDEDVLRSLPLDDTFSSVILSCYVMSVSFAYPMQCYPAVSVLAEVIKYHDPHSMPSERILTMIRVYGRPIFVFLTFAITYAAPFPRAFVSLVGNLCTSLLAIAFPALMNICMRYPQDYGPRYIILVKDILLAVIGLTIWLLGIYYSWQYFYVLIHSYYESDPYKFY